MRVILYISGILLIITAIFCLLLVSVNTSKDWHIGVILGISFLFGGAIITTAAIRDYLGGFRFLFGILILSLSIFTIGGSSTQSKESLIPLLTVGLTFMVLGFILVRLGHKRHKSMRVLLASRVAEANIASTNNTDDLALFTEGDSVDKFPGKSSLSLYPPMKTWRTFLLLIFSGSLYSIFLTYRIARDLYDMGEKKFRPKSDATKMLIPLFGFVVFSHMANSAARLAKSKGVVFKLTPSILIWLLVLTGLATAFSPVFLYPLTVSIAAIPWLLLHRQMNCLRQLHTTDWHQPANSYTWLQRSVLIVGVPLMALVLMGSKTEFLYYAANRLAVGQTVFGHTPIYQLRIPDRQWREVPPGTLSPDTNLELVNKPMNEWVVVRVQINQQQTLDSFVDQRREIVASDWKDFKVVETRTLDSGANLTPLSLAHYTEKEGLIHANQPLFVATVVTPEHVVEVIGQGSKNAGSTVVQLVKSFQLTAKEGKQ